MSTAASVSTRSAILSPLRILGLVVVCVAVVLFFRRVNTEEVWHAIRRADGRLLLAASAMNVLTLLVKSERWMRMLRPLGRVSRWNALRYLLMGFALNSTLPASAGDVVRVFLVSSHTGARRSHVVTTIVLERLVEAVALVLLMVGALPLLAVAPWLRSSALVFAVTIIVGVIVLVLLVRRHRLEGAVRGWRRITEPLAAVARGLSSRAIVVPIVVLSAIEWVCQTLSYTCGIAAFSGGFPWHTGFACLCAVNIALLARVTPGGVGAYQVAFAAILTLAGIDKETGLAVSAAHHVVTVLPPVACGLALLIALPADARRRALQREPLSWRNQ